MAVTIQMITTALLVAASKSLEPLPIAIDDLVADESGTCASENCSLELLQVRSGKVRRQQPNILLLMLDQWRYDWDGYHSPIALHLPTVERLAENGVRFTQAYVPSPLCAPSRASLASGREYDQTGVPTHAEDFPRGITTFYSLLRSTGYHTMTAGKDDLTQGSALGFRWGYPGCPTCRDGDGLYRLADLGFSDGLRSMGKYESVMREQPMDNYSLTLKSHLVKTRQGTLTDAWQAYLGCIGKGDAALCESETFSQEDHPDDIVARGAIALLQRRPLHQPFFLQVNFPGPHPPYEVTPSMMSSLDDRWLPGAFNGGMQQQGERCNVAAGTPNANRSRCNYAAGLQNLDRLFKSVIDQVEAQEELNNTLIVVTSDHGEMLGDHGLWNKKMPWQQSVAVPLIIAGPWLSKGRVVESPVATLDVVGTFLDFAGVKPAEGMTTVSMRSLLQPGSGQPYRSFVSSGLSENVEWRLVVKEVEGVSYKYMCCVRECPAHFQLSKSGGRQMLIDVKADPFDMNDLSSEKPEIVASLRALLPAEGYSGNFSAGCAEL